jgi:hypothetical protein
MSKAKIAIILLVAVIFALVITVIVLGVQGRKKSNPKALAADGSCRKLVSFSVNKGKCPAGHATLGTGGLGKNVCVQYAPVGQVIDHVVDINPGKPVARQGRGSDQAEVIQGCEPGYREVPFPDQSVTWVDEDGKVYYRFGVCVKKGPSSTKAHYKSVRVADGMNLRDLLSSVDTVCARRFGSAFFPIGIVWTAKDDERSTRVSRGSDGKTVRPDVAANQDLALSKFEDPSRASVGAAVVCGLKSSSPCSS